jgi:Asp-tRNA(Asn)/Glu-tRNA(Gln) amidotransferase A subunit family amidase
VSVSAQDYIDASRERGLCNGRIREAFNGIDAMLSPTVIRPPHNVDDSISYGPMDDRRGTSFQRFTVPFDYNGYPTVSVPAGLNRDGLPLSIQVSGHPLSEEILCRIARTYEKNLNLTNFHPFD